MISSTLQVIEDITIVWVYKDNAKDRLLEGSDVKSIPTHIECISVADDSSPIVSHVSVKEDQSQSKNISSIRLDKIYNILKCFLKLVVKVVIKLLLIKQQFL